jgi:hypothetical protein
MDDSGLQEQPGWLTSIGPTDSMLQMLQRLFYATRQYGELEGLVIKAYNLWGQDWNNTRPISITVPSDYKSLSGGLEKIKINPTY